MAEMEDVVISGISGRLPECNNVEEFWKALYEGIDLVTTDEKRYPGYEGHRTGKIKNIDRFDASFFGCNPKLSNTMDPRQRILLEAVYECIVDAGYNPNELKGTKTGVYVGIPNYNYTEELKLLEIDGNLLTGTYLSMAANRVSYVFDFKGPSYTCDSACSSSHYALIHAFNDLKNGVVDYALVGATHVNFDPEHSKAFDKLNMTSPKGVLRAFSAERDGYVRSEAVVSFLLQKKSDCKRAYAILLGGRTTCEGYKKEGIIFPSYEGHINLLNETYNYLKINPDDITYFEAHGTGTKAGDSAECTALSEFFRNRKEPLLVGSVKTNMGHSEICAGACGILKALAILRTGKIPGNLNSEPIDTTLPGIEGGNIKVVTQNTSFKPGLLAISSLGFGGAIAHVVLKMYQKDLDKEKQQPNRRLVLVSGRTLDAIDQFLGGVQINQDDREFLFLVDDIHKININGHLYRGYVVLGKGPVFEKDKFLGTRPVWFIYTGVGCQWPTMGRDLLKFDTFEDTFNRCAEALKPYGIDLYDIVTSDDPTVLEDIRHSFTAICAVQVALTDVLKSLGIAPDWIAGYSMGEIACGYADGTLTAEQAVLCAFSRGYGCHKAKSKLTKGVMAAIDLPQNELLKILPKGVYIGCRNSPSSVTLSGPEKITKDFVEDLQSKGIFARIVETNGVAFHSEYVNEAGNYVLEFLRDVIKTPKRRSPKWLSSSVLHQDQFNDWAQYNSPEYHHNNFCNPVRFDQILENIQKNAVVIEIGPHGLLQAILKRELPSTVSNISLINKRCSDNEEFFLSAIGRLYLAGCQPQMRTFYPEVKLPVSSKTATISSLVKWDHSMSWMVPQIVSKDSYSQSIVVNISESEWSYLEGHAIDGMVLLPAATCVMLIWRVFSKMHSISVKYLPVIIQRISILRSTVIFPNTDMKFYVNILRHSGDFEVAESNSIIATGNIMLLENYNYEHKYFEENIDSEIISMNDFYQEVNLRKYNYRDLFKCVTEYDMKKNKARIMWYDKYDVFLDGMIQTVILDYMNNRDLRVPTFIEKIIIDPRSFLNEASNKKEVPVVFNRTNLVKCKGLEMHGLVITKTSGRQHEQNEPLLETHQFISYGEEKPHISTSLQLSLTIALDIILQNCNGIIRKLNICEICNEDTNTYLTSDVSNILAKKPLTLSNFNKVQRPTLRGKYDVILCEGSMDSSILENLNDDGFIINKGSLAEIQKKIPLDIIFHSKTPNCDILLLRKPTIIAKDRLVFINIRNDDLCWLEELKAHISDGDPKVVYLLSQCDKLSGIMGLSTCLNKDPSCCTIKCLFTDEKISLDDDFYKDQIKKNLLFNILRNKNWGTYVHLPLEDIVKKEVNNAAVNIRTVGNLSSLEWIQTPPLYTRLEENSVIADVFYSALNFRDVMLATGKMQYFFPHVPPTAPDTLIGLDFSGISEGKRIMGICNYNGIALQCKVDKNLMWEVPDHWTLEDAATIPVVYITAYYTLIMRGQLQTGESILIHAGTGATGMAAISIALSMNCEVFTTISTTEKKEFLKEMFPQLKDENFGNSRNKSFEDIIMNRTKGRGVNVIVNSLAGELMEASLRCLSEGGRFLELGKVDFFKRKLIDSYIFMKNCSFHGILLEYIFHGTVRINTDLIKTLVTNGINSGIVRPLPRTVFEETHVEEAFRFLSAGKHRGRVLIQIRKEEERMLSSPSRTISATPKIYFEPKKSYVITGGLGGVGLELANWMIKKGATKIILNSRRGITNSYQTLCLAKWKKLEGIEIEVSTENSSDVTQAYELIKIARKLGPVGGIFCLAAVLMNALVINQTIESFQTVFEPKIQSVKNLDQISRSLCKELDYFVAFSSVACGLGSGGQCNYGMANSVLERICEERKKEGLPGLAVQYGLIGEVGMIHKTDITALKQVYEPQKISSCLNVLEKFMLQEHSVVLSMVCAMKQIDSKNTKEKTPADTVAIILGIKDTSKIDPSSTLVQLGIDSLMIAEVKQTLYKEYEVDMEVKSIQDLTFGILLNWNSNNKNLNSSLSKEASENDSDVSFILPERIITEVKLGNSKQNIFFLHPIDGNTDKMASLALRLNANVYGLQCTSECKYELIEEFGALYERIITEKQTEEPYILCGYSYGVLLVLEIAYILEAKGLNVKIICIDGSPDYTKCEFNELFNNMESRNVHEQILIDFAMRNSRTDRQQVSEILMKFTTEEEQTYNICKMICEVTGMVYSEIESILSLRKARIIASRSYNPTYILNGPMLFFRTDHNKYPLSEEYGLKKICKKVHVVKIEADHSEIILGENADEIANIINEFIDVFWKQEIK